MIIKIPFDIHPLKQYVPIEFILDVLLLLFPTKSKTYCTCSFFFIIKIVPHNDKMKHY